MSAITCFPDTMLSFSMEATRRDVNMQLFESGLSAPAIYKQLKHRGYARSTVFSVIARCSKTDTAARQSGSGGSNSLRSPELKQRVRERIRRNPQRSLRRMAPQLGISERTLRRLVKDDLYMKAYSSRSADDLSPAQCASCLNGTVLWMSKILFPTKHFSL